MERPNLKREAALAVAVMSASCSAELMDLKNADYQDAGAYQDAGMNQDAGDTPEGWQKLIDARYRYMATPVHGADRAVLEDVSPDDIREVARQVEEGVFDALKITLTTLDPKDSNLDAERVCDQFGLSEFGTLESPYLNCDLYTPLPGGPEISTNGERFAFDRIGINPDTGFDIVNNEPTNGPAIYKTRFLTEPGGRRGGLAASFFLNLEHAERTGEQGRQWRVQVTGFRGRR
ncbi:hypothetical protein COV82_05660 [Candidatus Peregrinibacteria bacterium CG11_big_fil_rev_8_21_14_0_20_46_8]|nr:MAG: hypothetical protein COV82_05660 [Candidatus Peregrinibacteria bacterium CG11_big_fil_rev_8_21_14_0_20_46_8]